MIKSWEERPRIHQFRTSANCVVNETTKSYECDDAGMTEWVKRYNLPGIRATREGRICSRMIWDSRLGKRQEEGRILWNKLWDAERVHLPSLCPLEKEVKVGRVGERVGNQHMIVLNLVPSSHHRWESYF